MGKQSHPRRFQDNEAFAIGRLLRTSPRKLNLVAATIRSKPIEEALNILHFSPKRIAGPVRKVLQSAIANAENNHDLNIDSLIVAASHVGKSVTMKRWKPRSRGRVGHVTKHFCRLTILLREVEK